MRRNSNSLVLLLIAGIIAASLFVSGCGGGGGGGSVSTLDPDQLEVASTIDGFAAAVRAENITDAQNFLDTNLKYERVGDITEIGADKFIARLKTFFDLAKVDDFQITNIGIVIVTDTIATGRADLSLSYTDNNGVAGPAVVENIELAFERASGGIWGLLEFGVYGGKGSSFPPEL
ncbi:MAG: hypothetical protein PHD82_08440 [Candidatus Riflebacteria bacterium]|nr:hypothetical protein [Candidatus Riflebacteria bacterium]